MVATDPLARIDTDGPAMAEETPAELRDVRPRKAKSAQPIALSVIIPVRNDPGNLALCLEALAASDHPDYEAIVVDDASTDATAEVARRHGARLLRMESRSGPAAARNRGARDAEHPYLFFVDADVCVTPRTLRQVAEVFAGDETVDALFGSYDSRPGASNALSQYRNLLHHWVHQDGNREAASFWSGCGAIKREVFLEMGGFDDGYDRPSIEDIEFGARLRRAGHRIVLAKHVQVKHMKRWSLWSMIRCDVLQRGIPWTLLVLRDGHIPNDLNLRYSQRLSALLAGGLVAMLLVGSWYYRSLLLVPLVVLLGVVLVDRWTTHRPVPGWLRLLLGSTLLLTVLMMLAYTAVGHNLVQLWSLLAAGCLLGIVLLNLRFYLFFAQVKHPLFVLLVIPLHVLYYLYSSLAFAAGVALHMTRGRARRAAAAPPGGDAK